MNAKDNDAAKAEMGGAKMYDMYTRRRVEYRNKIIGESDYPGRGYLIERTLNLEKIIFAMHESDYIAARLIDVCCSRIKTRAGGEDYLAALELGVFILSLPSLPEWASD